MENSPIIELVVNQSDSGLRIEAFLRSVLPTISRARWRKEVEAGRVKINDKIAKVGEVVRENDRVSFEEVSELKPGRRESLGEEIIIPYVVFENESIFVFNKPRKMHSVLQREEDPLTLADCAVIYDPKAINASPNVLDGGLVQRLDFYTDGLCMVAKSREVWEGVHQDLKNHLVIKTYSARVSPLIKKRDLERGVREGYFDFARILSQDLDHSTVSIGIRGGGRHIVRKSFSDLGFPLLYDAEYGCPLKSDEGFYLTSTNIEFSLQSAMLGLKLAL